MKTKIFIPFIIAVLTMLSCDNKEDCCFNIGPSIALCVEDQYGNDLFDQKIPGAIDTTAMEIYCIKNGEPVLIYNEMMDAPRGYWFVKYPDIENLVMHFAIMSDFDKDNKSTTIIKWNNLESDTITILAERNPNSVYAIDHWINDSKDIDWINSKYNENTARIIKQR